jgi:hypothetical protein
MSKEWLDPPQETGKSTPLFYRRRVNASGETDEIAFGACGVLALKWLVIFILGVLLALSGRVDPPILPLLRFILKLLN